MAEPRKDPDFAEMSVKDLETFMQANSAEVDDLRGQNERAHKVLEVKEAMERQDQIRRRPPGFPPAQGFKAGHSLFALQASDLDDLETQLKAERNRRKEEGK